MSVLELFVLFFVFVIAVLLAIIVLGKRVIPKLVYQAEKLENQFSFSFEKPFEELFLSTIDGAKINVVHFTVDQPKGAILYFHGNRGSLKRWGKIGADFTQFHYDVFVLDYHGYGKSTGEPNEQALYNDAFTLFYHVKELNYKKIIYFGRSLGSGVASWLSCQQVPDAMILETPFHNLGDVIKKFHPLYKVHGGDFQFPSMKYLRKSSIPILMLHGTKDNVVPMRSAKLLVKSIENENAHLVIIENGKHNNLSDFQEYWQAMEDFFKQV